MMQLLEVHVTKCDGENVILDQSIEVIRNHISLGKPVILRGILTAKEAQHIREYSRNWARQKPTSNPKVCFGIPNYHRIDKNHKKSKLKSILHLYTYFYWNSESAPVAGYFRRMFRIRNKLSDLPDDYAMNNIQDRLISIPVVQQYPRGGGYLHEHIDPDIGQKVIVNVILSTFSHDFRSGGLFYRDENGNKVYVDPMLHPGDAFIFHPKSSHGVDPIDVDDKLDWSHDDGRWMCFSALVTVNSLNGIDDGTGPTSSN